MCPIVEWNTGEREEGSGSLTATHGVKIERLKSPQKGTGLQVYPTDE